MIDILHVISFFFSKKYFTYTSRVDRLDRQSTRDPYVHGTLLPSFTNLFLIPVTRFHLPSYPSSSSIEPSPVPFHWPLPRTRLLFDILLYSSSSLIVSYPIPAHLVHHLSFRASYLTPSLFIHHRTFTYPFPSVIVPLPIPLHWSLYLTPSPLILSITSLFEHSSSPHIYPLIIVISNSYSRHIPSALIFLMLFTILLQTYVV